MERLHGLVSLAFTGQCQAPIEVELSGFGAVPTFGRGKETVGSSVIALQHGLRAGHGLLLAAGVRRPLLGLERAGQRTGGEDGDQGTRMGHASGGHGPDALGQEQDQGNEKEPGVLVHIVCIRHRIGTARFEIAQAVEEGVKVHEARSGTHICATTGLDHRHEHPLVEGGDHRLAAFVLLVSRLSSVTVELGNRPA